MAGSLQARAERVYNSEEIDITPDACPQPHADSYIPKFCLRTFPTGEISVCPYAYSFTESTVVTERIDTADMLRWMTAHANRYKRVRVLCMLAKSVDRAGA